MKTINFGFLILSIVICSQQLNAQTIVKKNQNILLTLSKEDLRDIEINETFGMPDDNDKLVYLKISGEEKELLYKVRCLLEDAQDESNKRNFKKAYDYYDQAEKFAPTYWLILMGKGVCAAQMGEKDKGIELLQKALKLNPGNERILRNLNAMKSN